MNPAPSAAEFSPRRYRIGLCYRASLLITGGMCAGLGIAVLIALATHRLPLAKLLAQSRPMPPAAAMGFVICGAGLILVGIWAPVVASAMAAVLFALAAAAAAHQIFGTASSIETLLAANLACGPDCAVPLAPNTLACFMLAAVAFAVRLAPLPLGIRCKVGALLGAAVLATGACACLGYMSGLPLYCWALLRPMSFLSSIGCSLLGLGLIMSVWRYSELDESGVPGWLPMLLTAGNISLSINIVIALRATSGAGLAAPRWGAVSWVLAISAYTAAVSCGVISRLRVRRQAKPVRPLAS